MPSFQTFHFLHIKIYITPTPFLSDLMHSLLCLFVCICVCRDGVRNFCLGVKCDVNIFIKTTSTHIYTHMCAFLLYIHIFYLISYIYTHNQKKKKRVQYFQSKLFLTAIFHKIKFIFSTFIVKFLKSFILNTNYQILC